MPRPGCGFGNPGTLAEMPQNRLRKAYWRWFQVFSFPPAVVIPRVPLSDPCSPFRSPCCGQVSTLWWLAWVCGSKAVFR